MTQVTGPTRRLLWASGMAVVCAVGAVLCAWWEYTLVASLLFGASAAMLVAVLMKRRQTSVPALARVAANPHAPDASLTHATVEVPRTPVSAEDIKAYRAHHPEATLSQAIDAVIRAKTQAHAATLRQERETD